MKGWARVGDDDVGGFGDDLSYLSKLCVFVKSVWVVVVFVIMPRYGCLG